MTKIMDYIKAMESGIKKGRLKAINEISEKEIDQAIKLVNNKTKPRGHKKRR